MVAFVCKERIFMVSFRIHRVDFVFIFSVQHLGAWFWFLVVWITEHLGEVGIVESILCFYLCCVLSFCCAYLGV